MVGGEVLSNLTLKLLKKASHHAAKSQSIRGQLDEAFNARYGATYSDADCDILIDTLDYLGGFNLTLKEVDAEMTRVGYPPIALKRKDQSNDQ